MYVCVNVRVTGFVVGTTLFNMRMSFWFLLMWIKNLVFPQKTILNLFYDRGLFNTDSSTHLEHSC